MRVIAVTGASSGIGRAIARAFGARGDTVALIARGRDGLDAAAEELREAGGTPLVYPLDVADRDAVDACADDLVLRTGQLDVWVNDAMVSVLGPAWSLSTGELDRVTRVNYFGAVWGTLAALRHMRAHSRGTIIQIGSLLSYRSIPMQSAYCASKAALRAFTDSLRSELHDEKSGVNLCHLLVPAVNTPQFDVIRNKFAGHAHPMGGVIYQPEVIAKAALWVADHPLRELAIGPMTLAGMFGQALLPGRLDRSLGKNARTAQVTRELPKPSLDNLLAPLPGDRGAHGSFDDEARSSSVQLWARMNAKVLTAGALAAAAALLWWRRRA
ncbi:MAG: SDR family oxidoreductase [Myxococcaceae bacterium]|nr:SDR family oxidoreductase [Myxococcaceae bacterium]